MRVFGVSVVIALLSACQDGGNDGEFDKNRIGIGATPADGGENASRNAERIEASASRQGITMACPENKLIEIPGEVICEGGDPAVFAALPAWAKIPKQVKVGATNVFYHKAIVGIAYTANYEGPLADIEPIFRTQIEREPGMRLALLDGSTMLVGRKDGDLFGSYLTLAPKKMSNGKDIVEIRFHQQRSYQ